MQNVEQKRARIVTFDILRGFFLLVILIDHLNYHTFFYEIFSGRGSLFASAAEGFFLISGLLVGYLFVEKMKYHPRQTTRRLLKRAAVLYAWSIGLTVAFTLLGYTLFQLGGVKALIWPGVFSDGSVLSFLWKLITLQYVYGWADFLSHYVVFMAIAPVVVWLTAHGKAWLAVIGSMTVWWFGHKQGFNYAWQVLFMLGIVAGYYLPQVESWWQRQTLKMQRSIFLSLVVVSISTILFSLAVSVFAPYIISQMIYAPTLMPLAHLLTDFGSVFGRYVDKDSLEYGRLIFALLWFVTTYLVVRTYEKAIVKYTKSFLNTIGARSLYVYGLQAFIVFFAHILVQNSTNFFINFAVITIAIALTYLAARYYSVITSMPLVIMKKFKQRTITYEKASH